MKQKIKVRTHRFIYEDDRKTIKDHYYEDNEAEYDVVPYQEPIRFWDEPKRIDTDYYEQQATQRLEMQNE